MNKNDYYFLKKKTKQKNKQIAPKPNVCRKIIWLVNNPHQHAPTREDKSPPLHHLCRPLGSSCCFLASIAEAWSSVFTHRSPTTIMWSSSAPSTNDVVVLYFFFFHLYICCLIDVCSGFLVFFFFFLCI
jgi:hypothetical protein